MAAPSFNWVVVGGSHHGGIIVRQGAGLNSPKELQRLHNGAVVRSISFKEGRLHYQLIEPANGGPKQGWVSTRLGEKDLLVPWVPKEKPHDKLTSDERRAIQSDLTLEYCKDVFQIQLHERCGKVEASFLQQRQARWNLCSTFQRSVFRLHGFVPSRVLRNREPSEFIFSDMLLKSHSCGRSCGNPCSLEIELCCWLEWLANPAAQAAHPRGPLCVHDIATVEALNRMGGPIPAMKPSRKVLAKIPCASRNMPSATVRVYGGLSGELIHSVDVPQDWRIYRLKEIVSQRDDTPPAQLCLLHRQRVVSDRETLQNLLEDGEIKCDLSLVRIESERAMILNKLEEGHVSLWDLPNELQNDPQCVLCATLREPLVVASVSDELRNNRNFMLSAVHLRGGLLEYASTALRADRFLVQIAVSQDGNALEFAAMDLRNDIEVVLAAVECKGVALQFASDDLRGDRSVVLAALEDTGMALQYAGEQVRGDSDIVLAAMRRNPEACYYAKKELLLEPSFTSLLKVVDMFDDTFLELLDRLMWLEPSEAWKLHLDGRAIFLDTNQAQDFNTSRIHGAHSFPTLGISHDSISTHSARCLLLDRPELNVIVYSTTASSFDTDSVVARLLRTHPNVLPLRIWRLCGGLSQWKTAGLPVQGIDE